MKRKLTSFTVICDASPAKPRRSLMSFVLHHDFRHLRRLVMRS